MGGTGLEPVTPSLSMRGGVRVSSLGCAQTACLSRICRATERLSERERTLILAIVATQPLTLDTHTHLFEEARHGADVRAEIAKSDFANLLAAAAGPGPRPDHHLRTTRAATRPRRPCTHAETASLRAARPIFAASAFRKRVRDHADSHLIVTGGLTRPTGDLGLQLIRMDRPRRNRVAPVVR
jgi:hypothetical protein